jgi:mono/diheme cytochrome c family protein
MTIRMLTVLTATILALPASASAQPAKPPAAEVLDHFEAKVRPVFVAHCQKCHGPQKQFGGLRLDTDAAVKVGGDSGPVIVPGDVAKSILMQAIRHEGDYKMPPNGKLKDEEIAAIAAWVQAGAPWPATAKPLDQTQASRHWAFQPVRPQTPPEVADKAWPRNPIDQFIAAQLHAHQLKPSPPADRRTLIRRVYYDLIGLPPTPEEVEAFVRDQRPDAYAELVERLLASPHYGERWARLWLDVARYSDTKGYVFNEDRNYPYAYTFRDYVIDSFNRDRPYNEFILHQLAADRLDLGENKLPLAAMGFLTVGRRFLNNQHDIIDDRLDVVTRGLMGLTVTCARCHDHKYDPIPIKDYYSLYGVFASSVEPRELPVIAPPPRTPEVIAFEQEVQKRQQAIEDYRQKVLANVHARLRAAEAISSYLLAVRDARGKNPEQIATLLRQRDLNPMVFDRWRALLNNPQDAEFAPLVRLADVADAQLTERAADLLRQDTPPGTPPGQRLGQPSLHPAVASALASAKLTGYADLCAVYGKLLHQAVSVQPPAPELAGLRQRLTEGERAPLTYTLRELPQLQNRAERDRLAQMQTELDGFKAKSPVAPPRAMVLNDLPQPVEPYVFVRGNPGNRGPNVPRQFLEILSGPQRQPFREGSGRLELARAIASPDNPLTARVIVNRVWAQYFGQGLVRTLSDFGLRSEPPSHPALLDWLAHRFVADGWSLKKLHRLIVTSATYQQSSQERADLAKLDPDNKLLGRMPRRRMDFEGLRDGLLAVSGQLDRRVGGKSVDLWAPPYSKRRTLYAFIDRQNLPGVFRTFDFALPDTHSPQRFTTTVPQQALFLLNHPFVIEQAKALVNRPEVVAAKSPAEKVQALYRLVYQRPPTPQELELTQQFIRASKSGSELTSPQAAWQYGYGGYDAQTKSVRFTPLPHFTGQAWQGGPNLPDSKLEWATLNAQGGHPASAHAVIRRWTAPVDGEVRLHGRLTHPAREGNGVRARIVLAGATVLGTWEVHHGQRETNLPAVAVRKGQTLDLIVDCKDHISHDSFLWELTIEPVQPPPPGIGQTWNTQRDFAGPEPTGILGTWEQLGQVLLLANEFAFVD